MKWYAPKGKDLTKESVNDGYIHTFTGQVLKSVVREVTQNSLDAVVDDKEPLMLDFTMKKVDISQIPDVNFFMYKAIPLARETWTHDSDAQKFLDQYENILSKQSIPVLKISDYNTTGLDVNQWEALIFNKGTSYKNREDSGGSFGIGKSAPFAASNLRMVFYETLTHETRERKSMGVTNFISFDEGKWTAEGRAYLGKREKEALDQSFNFGFQPRHEPGTDVYIMAFNQSDDWEKKALQALIENFLVSIYFEKATFTVEGEKLNKNTLDDYIQKFKDEKSFKETLNYYSVLKDTNKLEFFLDERFEKYGYKPEDAVFYLSTSKDANRSVLMTRSAGMKIFDRKRISGSIQFNGIFTATGKKINHFLKQMENPSHDNWNPELSSDPKTAKQLLTDLYQFFKKHVQEELATPIDNEIDAFGVSDFLPSIESDDEEDEIGEASFDTNITEVEIKSRRLSKANSNLSEEKGDKLLEGVGRLIPGEYGGNLPNGRTTVSPETPNKHGVGTAFGVFDAEETGDRRVLYRRQMENNKDFSYKIIEQNYAEGRYRFILKPLKKISSLKVTFEKIGESGFTEKLSILSHSCNLLSYQQGSNIYINDVESVEYLFCDVIFDETSRFKVEVTLYGN